MANYFTAPIPTIEIYLYTDSEINIKPINQTRHRRGQEFPNKTLSPSWDLHQAIHRELIKLPNIAICHIKAHQDLSTLNAELSWEAKLKSQEAKLNIEADKLAEEAYSSSTFSDQVPMIPGVSAQLLINGKTIISKHRVIARDIRWTKAIKLRIQEKTGMTDQAFDDVDWDSHTMAVGRSQLSQPFLVKLLPISATGMVGDICMLRHRIHNRNRVTQQQLHTIDEYFPTLLAGTANRLGPQKLMTRPGNFLLSLLFLGFSTDCQVRT
jgi:ribonuclease HI